MPISLGNGGSGRPYIRFSPQANAWMKAGPDGPEEFTAKDALIAFDVERLVLGWLTLGEGVREWAPWPANDKRTKAPSMDAKTGFVCLVYAPKVLGEDVYEFSANATASTRFIQDLYNACEAEFGKGKVPLVKITGSKPIKIGKGTTREILWEVAKWIDRPVILAEADPRAETEKPQEKAPPKSETKREPELAAAGADEF